MYWVQGFLKLGIPFWGVPRNPHAGKPPLFHKLATESFACKVCGFFEPAWCLEYHWQKQLQKSASSLKPALLASLGWRKPLLIAGGCPAAIENLKEDHELAKAATQISELCQPALPASLLRGTPTAHGGALAIPRHGCQQRSGVIKIPWLTVGPSTLHPKP